MLLTNDEMQLVRQAVEVQAGLDSELVTRCGPLVHIAAFDDAVRQAFVVLEERLRRVLKRERATGMQMVAYAFSNDGPFTKLLADTPAEREGFHDLLSGAFKLYRNPTAHTIVGYDGAEARAIINLIDLLLKRVDRLAASQVGVPLPANLEQMLKLIEASQDSRVASRVRIFAGKSLKAGLTIRTSARDWLPFRKHARVQVHGTGEPKPHLVTVYYIVGTDKAQGLWFPVNQYYRNVVGLDIEPIKKELKRLGFQSSGKSQDFYADLRTQHDQAFLDEVLALVCHVAKQFEGTLG